MSLPHSSPEILPKNECIWPPAADSPPALKRAMSSSRRSRSRSKLRWSVMTNVGSVGEFLLKGFVAEDRSAHEGGEDLSDERLLARPVSGADLERRRAVREHLRDVHLAPLADGRRGQRGEPVGDLLAGHRVEEGLHGASL